MICASNDANRVNYVDHASIVRQDPDLCCIVGRRSQGCVGLEATAEQRLHGGWPGALVGKSVFGALD